MNKKKRVLGRSPSIDQGQVAMFKNSAPKFMKQGISDDLLNPLNS